MMPRITRCERDTYNLAVDETHGVWIYLGEGLYMSWNSTLSQKAHRCVLAPDFL